MFYYLFLYLEGSHIVLSYIRVLKIKNIKEASVVSIKDKIEHEKIILYLSLNSKTNLINIIKLINKKINNNFGNFAQPKHIIILDELPKTRSGKITGKFIPHINCVIL